MKRGDLLVSKSLLFGSVVFKLVAFVGRGKKVVRIRFMDRDTKGVCVKKSRYRRCTDEELAAFLARKLEL